jgi:hypothetical protein
MLVAWSSKPEGAVGSIRVLAMIRSLEAAALHPAVYPFSE